MEMTCSECGHGFLCRDVLNPAYGRLAGFWEHEPRRRLLPAFVRTLGWLVLPFLFWRRVQLHHTVRPARLIVWAAVLPVSLLLLAAAARVAFVLSLAIQGVVSWRDPVLFEMLINACTMPFVQFSHGHVYVNLDTTVLLLTPCVTAAAMYPLMLFLLPVSRKRSRVRLANLCRGLAYGLSIGALLAAIELVISASATALALTRPVTINPYGFRIDQSHQFHIRYYELWELAILPTLLLTMLFFVWLAWFWNRAIVRGFMLSQGGLIWALLTLTALLASVVVSIVFSWFEWQITVNYLSQLIFP